VYINIHSVHDALNVVGGKGARRVQEITRGLENRKEVTISTVNAEYWN
jgi:hypothetical protein